MFDKITINPQNRFNEGILTESLLFYQETNLILAPGNIEKILNYCGVDNLQELVDSGQLNLKYNPSALGAGYGADKILFISSFAFEPFVRENKFKKVAKKIEGNSVASEKTYELLMTLIQEHSYAADYQELLKNEVLNKENLMSALKIISKGELQDKDINIKKIEKIENAHYYVDSNLDNKLIESAAQIINKSTSELYDSQTFNSAVVLNSKKSSYVDQRLRKLLKQRIGDENQIQLFQELVLPEFVDLRGTINSGAKNFDDYMNVWREANKFKHWLKKEEPNIELLTKYNRKVQEVTWLNNLPAKNARWLIFAAIGTLLGGAVGGAIGGTVVGTVGTGTSLAVDYFDDLILGSLLKNWKPDQFIEGEYKDFLNTRI